MGRNERVLSKRHLRGNDLLMKNILVTVGSTNFKFDRFFKIMDEIVEEGVLDGNNIVAQTGIKDYEIKNYKNFEFVSNEEMGKLQSGADVIICHAGTGTVTNSLSKGKKVIVFPRLKKFGEHESDNQLELASAFQSAGYVLCATNKEELITAIKNIDNFLPKEFSSNNKNFMNILKGLLEHGRI